MKIREVTINGYANNFTELDNYIKELKNNSENISALTINPAAINKGNDVYFIMTYVPKDEWRAY